jgi:hypothetical protein
MDEWISFDRWAECATMQRPGYVFEVINSDGQRLVTQCEPNLPMPFDWRSAPLRFRLVPAAQPRHSDPLPSPSRRP